MTFPRSALRRAIPYVLSVLVALAAGGLPFTALLAQEAGTPPRHAGGEAALVLPDLGQSTFLGGIDGRTLLLAGLIVCALGLVFGLVIYKQLQEHAGAPLDARGLRADLRDLQDLPA